MQNINFNNESNMQSINNKKELCRTVQKFSRTQTKKQPLDKERKDKERYFEKVKAISSSKVRFSSSKQIPPALALKKLNNDFLLSQTKTLVQKERKLNIYILQHLQEIESRKLYLNRGFSSLFDYAVRELSYSRGSAFRRIKAMKLCQDIPETKNQLESGNLNLSSASQLQNFFEKQARKSLKKDLKKDIFSQTTSIKFSEKQQSKNLQSDESLFQSNIKENLPDKERADKTEALNNLRGDSFCAEPHCSAEPKEPHVNKGLSLTKKKELLEKAQGQSTRDIEKILVETDSSCVSYHKEKTRFIGNQKIELKVVLDEDCFKNLENLKNLLSHKNPRMSYRELISLLAELGLKKYDPSKTINQKTKRKKENQKAVCSVNVLKTEQTQFNKKSERKSKEECNHINLNLFNKEDQNSSCLPIKANKGERKNTTQNDSPSNKDLNKSKIKNKKILNEHTIQKKPKKNNRSIPQKIRQYIWKRDQGECNYICSQTKNKCHSKHLLQIDHIQPFALGGSHHPNNLRLLCARHNQLRSQRTFGFKL